MNLRRIMMCMLTSTLEAVSEAEATAALDQYTDADLSKVTMGGKKEQTINFVRDLFTEIKRLEVSLSCPPSCPHGSQADQDKAGRGVAQTGRSVA